MTTFQSAIIDFPEELMRVLSYRFYLTPSTFAFSSPISGEETVIRAHQKWMFEISTSTLDEELWRKWNAFIARLEGMVTLVRIWDPGNDYPLGTASGPEPDSDNPVEPWSDGTLFTDGSGWTSGSTSALVAVAAEKGDNEMVIGGLRESEEIALEEGDKFGIGEFTYQVIQRAASNASGESMIQFRPALREDVLVGAEVNFYKPTFVGRLMSNDDGIIEIDIRKNGAGGAKFVEVLPWS